MAKDEAYEAAVAKGTQLLRMLSTDYAKTAQLLSLPKACARSAFTSVEDLDKHGYIKHQKAQLDDGTVMSRLARASRDLSVDNKMVSDGGKNIIIRHAHTENRRIEGAEYTVSQRSSKHIFPLTHHRRHMQSLLKCAIMRMGFWSLTATTSLRRWVLSKTHLQSSIHCCTTGRTSHNSNGSVAHLPAQYLAYQHPSNTFFVSLS
jgi:hypothetical protein